MSEIHFLRPYFLFLIIPAFLLILFQMLRYRQSAGPWQDICSKDLLPYVLAKNEKRSYFPCLLSALTMLLLITAMSGPAWQQISQPLVKQKTGIVIALDLSPVMDAQDLKPSRLQRAIYKINDLLEMHQDGQIALIAFSADPFVVTPLTDDIATIKNLLPALETKIMPSSGHRVSLAISKASNLLKQSGINNGSILLMTSELSQKELDASVSMAKDHGSHISVLGVGTDDTAPIPQAGGGFVKNDEGALVMATFSRNNLNALAQSTGGAFAAITVDDQDLRQLSNITSGKTSSSTQEETDVHQNKWHDQGYLLVMLALPFASLAFRKGVLLLLFFLMPHRVQAISFDDLWKTKDQQAQELFQQEKYAEANELFQNQEWQGICSYKLGDYETAANLFQENATVEGLFNYGTAKAKLGDFDAALEAYDKALQLQPEHEDALYNKNLIDEFLKKNQNQNNDNNQDKDNNKDKSKSDKKDKNNQSQNENPKNQQNKDKQTDDPNQSQPQDGEEGQDQEQQQDQNSDGDSSEEKAKSEKNDTLDLDTHDQREGNDQKNDEELSQEYRDQIEKEMQKEEARLSENEMQKAAQELKDEIKNDPQRHIDECWLKRIQDDPAGLLRRKFLQQYRQQQKAK
ncbi:MAG: VWA domain-containing protein [Parachlamydiaceae bacterium]|nr:VWA domain-containing protein [Parachlamydiaceae bacterium]